MDSRIEKHNLTFGVVAIAITLAATMNVSLIPIPIANAINTSVDNSLSSNRISFTTYDHSITSNTTSIPTISRAQLLLKHSLLSKISQKVVRSLFRTTMVQHS
jgi:bacillopeptidase F (M6 metalloprotease family)